MHRGKYYLSVTMYFISSNSINGLSSLPSSSVMRKILSSELICDVIKSRIVAPLSAITVFEQQLVPLLINSGVGTSITSPSDASFNAALRARTSASNSSFEGSAPEVLLSPITTKRSPSLTVVPASTLAPLLLTTTPLEKPPSERASATVEPEAKETVLGEAHTEPILTLIIIL